MKNFFRTLAIVALGFFATSCVSADVDDVQMASGEGVVNFTVSTPGATSRAIADGKSATQLTCGVYDAEWNYLTTVTGQFDGSSLTTTVSIRLVNKKVYNFVFWAQDPNADCYTLTLDHADGPNVAVTYNGDANDESRDAFFGQLTDLQVNGTMNEKVELTRPFAQVNFGTLDTELAKVAGFDITVAEAKTTVTTRAYNTLYLGNGQHGAVGGAQDVQVTFSDAALPNEDLYLLNDTEHTTPYDWLAMNYILVPEAEGSLSECTLVVKDNKGQSVEIKYPNAPVKRNWRTNLVGNLLTDQVVIEVEILPIPEGEYTEIVPDKPYEENGVYSVASADEMLWIAQQAGLDNGFFGNKTITLGGDINMTGYEWTTPRVWSNLEYLTTFDGKGHTISGLTAPLFKEFRGTIKNLVIDGANIESEAGPLGAVVCNLAGNIENVTVKNSTLSGVISSRATADTKRWGAIVGLHSVGDAKNLLAENVTISGVTKVAGALIGTINETNNRIYTNCKAVNCQVEAGDNVVGAIVGQIYVSGVYFVSCSQEGTTPTALVGDGVVVEGAVSAEGLQDVFTNGGTVTALEDITLTEPMVIAEDAEVVLDLGGKSLATNGNLVNNGTLTLKNGTVTAENDPDNANAIVSNGGELTIENVEIKSNCTSTGAAIRVNGGTATINGANTDVEAQHLVILADGKDTHITVNGGTYYSNSSTNDGSWTYAVKAQNGATITINGGSFEGKHGVVAASTDSHIIINDGTFFIQEPANGSGYPLCASGANAQITVYGGKFSNINAAGASGYAYGGGKFNLYGGLYKYKTFWGGVADNVVWVNSGDAEYPWTVKISDAATQESLNEAVATPNAIVKVDNAEYTIPATIADGVTIIGEEGSVLNCSNNIAAKNITIKNTHLKGNVTFDNASGTFEDCKIDGIFGETDQHLSFKNCQLGGYIATQTDFYGSASFEGCEISGWSAIGGTGEATFKNCKFPYSESNNHLRIYNLDKAEFENCEFDPNYTIDVKGISGSKNVDIVFNNCKVANTVSTLSTRAASTKKFIELFDLAILKKFTAATYVIDGTRVNSNTTIISNAEELIAKAAVNAAADEVVILTADIDLAGKTFGGLYGFNPENNNTFDGMGFTVSNWTNDEGKSDFGFIRGWVGPIKNVTIANATLKTSGRSAIVAGKVYGDIKNCHVVDCTIEDSFWACGLIAGHYNSGSVYNCTVTGSSVKSNGATGGIVGLLNESAGTRGFYNCSITNSTVNNTGVYGESYCGALVCGMINISNSTVEFEGCTFDGNTKEGKYVGDLYYAADSDITIVVK